MDTSSPRLTLRRALRLAPVYFSAALAACSSGEKADSKPEGITFRADVATVKSPSEAKERTFIPPFLDCRDPKAGETGQGPDGQVCTHVAISGCTEPGKYFPDYASCDVVRTQRPFWPEAPAREPQPNDPRLSDAAYLGEMAWVKQQVEACACTCCHDARSFGGKTGQWDIDHGPLWMDTLSDSGLALFAGLADSSSLGAYPASDNHGFDRTQTGIPTTDTARMKAFTVAELARRGISQDEARAVPPFGGPIYTNRIAKPAACRAGEGVDPEGRILWQSGVARYVYVMAPESENPGVPPNLDLPAGTLFRLDVLASAAPLASGVSYGTTPPGSFQYEPDQRRAPALTAGATYHLYVLQDVGIPIANCLFTFGEPVEPIPPPSTGAGGTGGATPSSGGATYASGGAPASSGGTAPATGGAPASSGGAPAVCALPGGDANGFGATCTGGETSTDCTCGASYCAVQPGAASGFCSKTGCKENPGICPQGWSCFDLSVFGPNLPSFCNKP